MGYIYIFYITGIWIVSEVEYMGMFLRKNTQNDKKRGAGLSIEELKY